MKKKLFFLLLPLIAAAWLACCHKDPPAPTKKDPCPWPEATTEGLNTFACKIDGKEWAACVNPWLWLVSTRPVDCTLRESDGSNFLSLIATRAIEDSTYSNPPLDASLIIGFKPCAVGKKDINTELEYASAKLFADWENISYEAIDTSAENFLTITHLDTDKNIISGAFQMTLVDEQSGKKTTITDGRFDLSYYPQ